MACAIWNTPARILNETLDGRFVESERAGGRYYISYVAEALVVEATEVTKAMLTTWLCEQRRAGIEIPKVGRAEIGAATARKRKSVTGRVDDALLYLGRMCPQLGDMVSFNDREFMECCAETESTSDDELFELYNFLKSTGLVEGTIYEQGFDLRPTYAGWTEIERLTAKNVGAGDQAFVAMWFHKDSEAAYTDAIVPAVRACGYRPLRIDQKEHNNKIDDEIIAEIRRSRFLVADFSCEKDKPRGGVYFEAGFAMGLGLPVIWTCRAESLNDVHFDTRQYAHVVWDGPADLFEKLRNRIGATIGDGPLLQSPR